MTTHYNKYIESNNAIDKQLGEIKMKSELKAEWEVVNMMYQSGSGFQSRLAELWMHSDLGNRAKLEKAFPETFSEFEDRYERHLEIMVEANANR